MFDAVDPKQSFPSLEEGILKYWREEDTFKRSIKRRENGDSFSFYDGPPFATGLPHYGHLLAGTIKDVIPRYQTMRGKNVRRRFGWDCHGLPVENLVEKEKNLRSKKDIEAIGTKAFNSMCRSSVLRYTDDWRRTVERLGRWVDMDWDYRTMDPDYMESIWWVFKSLYEQELIYEGYKAMHVCPRCATPLSNFEVSQGYKDRDDQSVIMTFPLKDDPSTHLMAWTTTPWSLPGNFWLAVGPNVDYSRVKCGDKTYILATKLVEKVFKGKEHEIVGTVAAQDLVGKRYEPLFPYFVDTVIASTKKSAKSETYGERVFKVILNDAVEVSDAEGTGIVHLTSCTGEDSYAVAQTEKADILPHLHVDGTFIEAVTDFVGLNAKPEGDDPMSTDKKIIENLKKRGRAFSSYTIRHSYPHCWRCDTPLLPFVTGSWYVAVEKVKQKMLAANAQTHWVPGNIRDGRFGKWLENARDWAISRNRYWGTPLPIWRDNASGKVEVIGSRDELMAKVPGRFSKIIVARHAESRGNVEKIYQGNLPGTDLTPTGLKQAKELGKEIAASIKRGAPATVVYCSPLNRTRQTAQAVADALGLEVKVDERLRELNFGEYEGKHIDFDDLTFVRERRAHKLATDQVESVFHFPGMETWESSEARCRSFFDEILPKHKGETLVVVTHADLVMNFTHIITGENKHKIVHQPYPDLARCRTFYWDFVEGMQMDLHKETVDELVWDVATPTTKRTKKTVDPVVHMTLVRHGETDWNKEAKLQGGDADIGLNATGKKQALKAAEGLAKGEKYDVVISSSLKRAKETAEILSQKLGIPFVGQWSELNERLMGTWSGLPIAQVLKDHPNSIDGAESITFHHVTPTDGESLQMFTQRTQRACDKLLKEFAGKRVLVVAHGGTIRAMHAVVNRAPYEEVVKLAIPNTVHYDFSVKPSMRRIPEVLDCWFESGSMPYAQEHFPFQRGDGKKGALPANFPADFIAEGLDQTRGWFYTLTVLSSALFDSPAFKHCIVNGIVLAEDGKKMSKRLKNYPEPTEVVSRHGADAVRFALMSSPAVRGEDLRFSEKIVEDVLRNVLLPLWNAYRLLVTYANGSNWKPSIDFSLMNAKSDDMLDKWIVAKTQALVNRMTDELNAYDLSATCAELTNSIDDLTNWYVRLSRRRFAGKDGGAAEAALDTLYRVLLANCQLLAPFCPFITEAIYLNLVEEDHGSIHFTNWPDSRELTPEELNILALMDNTQTVTRLGLRLRSDAKIGVRTPLHSVTFVLPPSDTAGTVKDIIQEELNVKQVTEIKDAKGLATRLAQVDARKVGPRLGGKVQQVIKAGKSGEFEEKDGKVHILGEELTYDEAKIVYVGKEGQSVAADQGIVVSLDTVVSEELKLEGMARDLVRAIQQLRKDAGLEFTDTVTLSVEGADDILKAHEALVLEETRAKLGKNDGEPNHVEVDGKPIVIRFKKD